jgi:hypothetical protein
MVRSARSLHKSTVNAIDGEIDSVGDVYVDDIS